MINKREYELLKLLEKDPLVDESIYSAEIASLLKDRLIAHNVTEETEFAIIYHGFIIKPRGHRAVEGYEAFAQSQKNEIEALTISKEANKLSAKSNKIAEKALHRSNTSLWIAAFSALFTLASVVVAIIAIFHQK